MAWVVVTPPIIIRHDVPDSEYLNLASKARGLVHLNLPDGEGVLIAPQWVLTAAHVGVELKAGDLLTIVDDGSYEVAQTFVHPDWVDGGPHDIALVRLRTPSETPPVPLYPGRDEVGRLVLVVGAGDFGTGLTGPTVNDGRVRAATNRVDSASDYWLRWVFDSPADPEATELEGISGPGDSGGPAYIVRDGTSFVAGISAGQSTRATGGREGLYGVTEFYTRVSSYQSWITERIEADQREDYSPFDANGRLMARANQGAASELVALEGGDWLSRMLYTTVRFELDDSGKASRVVWGAGDQAPAGVRIY